MSYFPINEDEISLIKFIAKYQYLNVNDAKYFFNSSRYYRNRIKALIDNNFLRKIKWVLVLGKSGIQYVKLLNFEYNKLNKNQQYKERLLKLSNFAAFYSNCDLVTFIPSFDIKDKEVFTTTARRFIGVLTINEIDYLTYSITEEHDTKYIKSILYDIQKEREYKNIIVLVNDTSRIELDEFCFGLNQVLIIEDSEIEREKLKYLNSVNWAKIIQNIYKNKAVLAEYSFCDYTDHKSKYISTFYFLDTEKINRIKYFLRENENKNADIICNRELEIKLKKELPSANYCVVDLEEYIDKERRYYYC